MTARTHLKPIFFFSVLILIFATSSPWILAQSELVQGVSGVVSGGAPGAVHPGPAAWSGIVAGDEDASFPSLFCAAREYGLGRVVIIGHEALLNNVSTLDNGVFLTNVLEWLNGAANGEARFTSGHSEFVQGGPLVDLAAVAGITLTTLPGDLTANSLSGISVLIVGNAWGNFTAAEIDAVATWVNDGGGLFLAGLGWSYPGDIDEYPMIQLAEPFDVRWLPNVIGDPTNQVNGSPVFSVFYPDIPLASTDGALDTIRAAHDAHGGGLPGLLESDAALRLSLVRAHITVSIPTIEFPVDHPQRDLVFNGITDLMNDFPNFYARGFSFNQNTRPTATHIRERAWISWRDAKELTMEIKETMVTAGQLTGLRLDLFNDFGLILLDNDRLADPEVDFIIRMRTLIPVGLDDLGKLSVRDYLGAPPLEVPLSHAPWGINIFGLEVGQSTENPFPNDVPRYTADLFASVLAHEMAHIVDADAVERNPALLARRQQLIADAGEDALNYLRSIVPDGFFVQSPQEFFASIANQFMNNSWRTLELGLVRFDAGRLDPINQAIFFINVLSGGTATSYFYLTDAAGNITREPVGICRNGAGEVTSLEVDDTRYDFVVDGDGRVLSYEVSAAVDSDNDGIYDCRDNCSQIENPDQGDNDGDLLGDACDPDDDNDGFTDDEETTAGSDPVNPASTPEVCDGTDNDLDGSTDEGFPNTDGDRNADCVDEDDDNDGVDDTDEIAAGSDPLNADSTPEVCDGIDNDLDGPVDEGFADGDGDGVADCVDNCPTIENPGQADSDEDGAGDACDQPPLVRGDCDGNATFNGLADASFLLNWQFLSGATPTCFEACDADGDSIVNGLPDALYILAHQFQFGPPPPAPYPRCGLDPDVPNSAGCESTACP